jgi:ubiquinone/menaquinone biosynthesis C-methylase UbiE
MSAKNSTTRFSDKVENYIKYRPNYPEEVIDYLKIEKILHKDSVIADIGSGTGISAEIFLKNGNIVYGIEPNKEMREAGERLLVNYKNFVSINGTAEHTTLKNDSISLIVAGQAFHWFDINKCKVEFKRILMPGGQIVLMWNARKLNASPFLVEYENLLQKYGTDYSEIRHENTDEKVFDKFFKKYSIKIFPNEQIFNYDGIKGRLLSSSYIPASDSERYEPMLEELKKIFKKHNADNRIKIEYETQVITGQI